MRAVLGILAVAFLAGLGVVIGLRMSPEAMGVVVGVVLGVAASIPMTLLARVFVGRSDKREEPRAPEPPVILPYDEHRSESRWQPGEMLTHNGRQYMIGADGGLYPVLPTGRQ